MAVREQGAKARFCVLHFGEDLLATVGAAKHGYDALNMGNVFRNIPRRDERCRGRRTVELVGLCEDHSSWDCAKNAARGIVRRPQLVGLCEDHSSWDCVKTTARGIV